MSYSRKTDAADLSWTPVSWENATWTFAAVYGEVEHRDWRWLWLRKRRRMVLLGYGPASDPPNEQDPPGK